MQSVIETIKQRLPIADVLASYITLIPAGSQYKAKCPFHNERTASFSVSPDRGLYYCFGCGAKGDMVTFVQEFEGVDFKGALKILADRAGVPLTGEYGKREATDPLYSILEKTTLRYQAELAQHPEALEYLTKRGMTAETIAAFRIGYAPDEWRFVVSSCEGHEIQAAVDAGLIKQKDATSNSKENYYDRFRGRIMFPLADASGRVVGFSGRIFPDVPDAPKYLNSPETAVFQKSRILFGFDKAKFAIKRHGFAILVEGQMDVVMSHQAGFKNTVATSGTAVSETMTEDSTAQLAVLARLSPQIFLAFDGDAAGQKALRRAATVALTLGMNPKVVPLPEALDPADFFLKNNSEEWKALLRASQHFIMHELGVLSREQSSPHSVVRLLKERIFPYLAKVSSPIERNLYLEQIAREVGVGQHEVVSEFTSYAHTVPAQEDVALPTPERISALERLMVLAEMHDMFKPYLADVETLSFEEEKISLPTIAPDRFMLLQAVLAREYMTVDESVAKELQQAIEAQFFAHVREKYTKALRDAEKKGDDVQTERIMETLQTLASRRHQQ